MRIATAKGVRMTTEDGRDILDFSSCFVSHNIGHQDPRVIAAITRQLNTLASTAPAFSTRPLGGSDRVAEAPAPGATRRAGVPRGERPLPPRGPRRGVRGWGRSANHG